MITGERDFSLATMFGPPFSQVLTTLILQIHYNTDVHRTFILGEKQNLANLC